MSKFVMGMPSQIAALSEVFLQLSEKLHLVSFSPWSQSPLSPSPPSTSSFSALCSASSVSSAFVHHADSVVGFEGARRHSSPSASSSCSLSSSLASPSPSRPSSGLLSGVSSAFASFGRKPLSLPTEVLELRSRFAAALSVRQAAALVGAGLRSPEAIAKAPLAQLLRALEATDAADISLAVSSGGLEGQRENFWRLQRMRSETSRVAAAGKIKMHARQVLREELQRREDEADQQQFLAVPHGRPSSHQTSSPRLSSASSSSSSSLPRGSSYPSSALPAAPSAVAAGHRLAAGVRLGAAAAAVRRGEAAIVWEGRAGRASESEARVQTIASRQQAEKEARVRDERLLSNSRSKENAFSGRRKQRLLSPRRLACPPFLQRGASASNSRRRERCGDTPETKRLSSVQTAGGADLGLAGLNRGQRREDEIEEGDEDDDSCEHSDRDHDSHSDEDICDSDEDICDSDEDICDSDEDICDSEEASDSEEDSHSDEDSDSEEDSHSDEDRESDGSREEEGSGGASHMLLTDSMLENF
ncbi:DEAD/DEAH box helicase domain-containing protein [Toxoplasma gondii RUB]|uniref:DEAD/DEAH box helicase domain-containing protein n=1 Tax=Toxoplasma gondii RUB TaxID=935652 RepID=A0A086M3T7_TOXGO|nr:DEAD/DEAH box helicase domain-containing protein [Toxoplasma gondii RUB]